MAKITFLGAAGTVTGSKYLIEAEGKRLLVDCGLFEGSKELKQRNWDKLAIDPASIDWVLLTHAHIDHTGYLPRLVRNGYRGPIYANAATHELCELLLPDSAYLQEEDAAFVASKGYSSSQAAAAALHCRRGASHADAIPRNSPRGRFSDQPAVFGTPARRRAHSRLVMAGADNYRRREDRRWWCFPATWAATTSRF